MWYLSKDCLSFQTAFFVKENDRLEEEIKKFYSHQKFYITELLFIDKKRGQKKAMVNGE